MSTVSHQTAQETNPQSADSSQWLRVCHIGRAQGLKGEVNVMSFTDSPEERFAAGSVLFNLDHSSNSSHSSETASSNPSSLTVESSRKFKNRWILKFKGVDDRNASEALNGLTLYVQKESDEVYLTDLEGLSVHLASDPSSSIGTITAVLESPAQALLEVTLRSGVTGDSNQGDSNQGDSSAKPRTVLVPYVKQIVPTVDVAGGFIVVDPPEGLLDL